MLKKIKDLGEEQVSKLATQLLSNEKFVTAMQSVMMRSLKTREQLEATGRFLLGTLGLPAKTDLEKLGAKIEEIDEMLDGLGEKLDALESAMAAPAAAEG